MKKLVVLAAMLLFAGQAFAGIAGTDHDLTTAPQFGSTITEICVYCHTPHNADTTVSLAPLWNRTVVDSTGSVYNTATLNAVADLASVNQTDAPLCLSCHDGSSLTSALVNPPNSGGAVPSDNITGDAALGTDLSNDHPIGFNYVALNGVDTEISQAAAATGLMFDNIMWCSSCHDVHDNSNVPFLQVSNAGSNLCLTCHIK